MDDLDLGVCLAVTTCILTMAQDHPDEFAVCYTKAVDRLNRVRSRCGVEPRSPFQIICEREYTVDYVYYKVPVPWLQVKLLRLLQYYPPSGKSYNLFDDNSDVVDDPTIRTVLHNVLQTIINNSQDTPQNVQHNNAQNAVLFEAINLAIHLDTESQVVDQAALLLGRFISSKETNVRYLGLETMSHLAGCTDTLEPIQRHQDTIILSLRDKDISVRRRALDLLYSMCDVNNARVVVEELLRYLHTADYALREEMVLKIAILTEKFATEYQWYVDIILQLISTAGDHVGDEVWYRIIQIVTNNEELQEYAARRALEHLRAPSCHENLVKVGGYILGEFGHLVANHPGCSPIEQFHSIHSKFTLCSPATRAMLMSTYIKFVNLFPEIRKEVLTVFHQYRRVLDAELHQRACEYIQIAMMPTEDLLQTVCEEMPPFPERESALISRLHAKHGATEDKRTWIIGGKDVNKEREAVRMQKLQAKRQMSLESGTTNGAVNGNGPVNENSDLLKDLAGLDLNGPTTPTTPTNSNLQLSASPLPSPSMKAEMINAKEAVKPSQILTHGWEKWWSRLTYCTEGILYEDAQLQIGLKSEYHGNLGRIALYFGNKVSTAITSFTTNIDSPSGLSVKSPQIPPSSIGPLTQIQQLFHVECLDVFTEQPTIRINFLAGSLQTVYLKLPILLTKFIEPITLSASDFFSRWKQIGGPPRECQKITQAKHSMPENDMKTFLRGFRFEVLEGLDQNSQNIVGAGVLHTTQGGKVGTLLRLEPNSEAKMFRLTVRATKELAATEIVRHMQPVLIAGLEPLG